MSDETETESEGGRRRIRMPIEDRVRPEDWIAEQPDDGMTASQQAEATYQASRRRFETEYGAGGA